MSPLSCTTSKLLAKLYAQFLMGSVESKVLQSAQRRYRTNSETDSLYSTSSTCSCSSAASESCRSMSFVITANGRSERALADRDADAEDNNNYQTRKQRSTYIVPPDYHARFDWDGIKIAKKLKHAAGLSNSCNDCFINATLQFVFHTPQLIRFLLLSKRTHNCSGRCAFCILYAYYRKIRKGSETLEANELREVVNKEFPNRIQNNQEDAHEMLIFLLSKLEPPLPRSRPDPKAPIPKTDIDRIFGGKLCSSLTCLNCNDQRNNFEDIRELNLNLNTEHKSECNDLVQIIEHYFGSEELGDFKCEKCNQTQGVVRKLALHEAPNILIIQLERFRQNSTKNSVRINIPMELELTQFMTPIKDPSGRAQRQPTHYRCYGYINHSGASMNRGHYTATIRGYDSKWYHFDDDSVASTNPSETNFREPYIIFYHKDMDPPEGGESGEAHNADEEHELSPTKNGPPATTSAT